MSNSSEIFSYATIYSNFKFLDELFFELSCLQTHRQTDRHTDRQTDRHTHTLTDTQTNADEYSIVAVDKPQL